MIDTILSTEIEKTRRTKIEITAAILRASLEGASRTRIKNKAYISYDELTDKYLPLLAGNGLLDFDFKSMIYRTTAKGREFLKEYHELKLWIQFSSTTKAVEIDEIPGI